MRLATGITFVWIWAIVLSIVACTTYDEGDDVAKEAFNKMTTTEKTMYDTIEEKWGQKRLFYVREAIGKRKIKPEEDSIPFYDIAKVIKSVNNVGMKPEDFTTDNTSIKKYNDKKFSGIDPKWFYTYIDPQKESFNKKEVVTNTGFKKDVIQKPSKQKPSKQIEEKSSKEEESYTINDLITVKEYSDIRRMTSDCDVAKAVLVKIAESGRPLTYSDFNIIKERFLYCKTLSLLEE